MHSSEICNLASIFILKHKKNRIIAIIQHKRIEKTLELDQMNGRTDGGIIRGKHFLNVHQR